MLLLCMQSSNSHLVQRLRFSGKYLLDFVFQLFQLSRSYNFKPNMLNCKEKGRIRCQQHKEYLISSYVFFISIWLEQIFVIKFYLLKGKRQKKNRSQIDLSFLRLSSNSKKKFGAILSISKFYFAATIKGTQILYRILYISNIGIRAIINCSMFVKLDLNQFA